MPKRPCLEAGCPAFAVPGKPRCPTHDRGNTTARGYGYRYQQARARLLANSPVCHWCDAPATTADHYPPLSTRPANPVLLPACQRCNSGRVALRRWSERQREP